MLFGSFKHTLDEKFRLVIPNRFRNEFTDKIFILKGFEGCLSLFSEKQFEIYIQKLQTLDSAIKSARDVQRVALSSVVELEIDSKNRIALPLAIVDKYQINKNLIVVGVIDHLEIWNSDKWDEYQQQCEPEFEKKFEELRGGKNG